MLNVNKSKPFAGMRCVTSWLNDQPSQLPGACIMAGNLQPNTASTAAPYIPAFRVFSHLIIICVYFNKNIPKIDFNVKTLRRYNACNRQTLDE